MEMKTKQMVGELIALKGDDEWADESLIVDVTENDDEGSVQVGFDLKKANARLYLSFKLHDLVKLAMDRT
jgi:hypothetical protein